MVLINIPNRFSLSIHRFELLFFTQSAYQGNIVQKMCKLRLVMCKSVWKFIKPSIYI